MTYRLKALSQWGPSLQQMKRFERQPTRVVVAKPHKSADKNPTGHPSNKASSGTRDGPVCYDRSILAKGCKDKYPQDHIPVHCVQWAGCVLLMSFSGILPEKQKMLNIFFHSDITLTDMSILQGGKWPGMPLVSRHARNWCCSLRFVLVCQDSSGTVS